MRPSPALLLLLAAITGLAAVLPGAETKLSPGDTIVYVGTYTGPKSKGIHAFRLKSVAGEPALESLGLAAEAQQPAFLDLDPKRRLLFSVNESGTFEGKPTGSISSWSIDAATGKLTLLSERASGGAGPCHLLLDRTGRNVLVANYSAGTVAVLPVSADGRLGEATSIMKHSGKSVNPQRQSAPHAHAVTLDPARGTLRSLGTQSTGGKTPRHFGLDPTGTIVAMGNQNSDTIMLARLDPRTGRLTPSPHVAAAPSPVCLVFLPLAGR